MSTGSHGDNDSVSQSSSSSTRHTPQICSKRVVQTGGELPVVFHSQLLEMLVITMLKVNFLSCPKELIYIVHVNVLLSFSNS